MFEHTSSHPGTRQWERSATFYLNAEHSEMLRWELESTMDAITMNSLTPFDHGEDHNVFMHESQFGRFVVKEVKPDAREMIILGHGIEPSQCSVYKQTQFRYLPWSTVDVRAVALGMQAAHEALATEIAEYNFLPTAIIPHGGQIFRVQRYIERPEPTFDQMLLPLTHQFYERVKTRWSSVLASPAFNRLPDRVKTYYRYFGLDHGVYTNAIFRGFIGSHPDIIIIDY